ncbi:AAA family ATPase [Parapedobacter lycopersici]|uniref:AAA family ATPase n=1 Tax=Parapedobacter lycopersici TaxID=1864939 RepID=UPI00333E9244
MGEQRFPPNRFFVITGGPGTGKTTLLDALRAKQFPCIPEVAREIIREQVACGGDALPWQNKAAYTQLMLKTSVESYLQTMDEYTPGSVVFFDRGIPDTLCYAAMIGLEIPDEPELASRYRYHRRVFILPPWPEIYHTDAERKQTWEEAVFTYEMMKKTYSKYGYQLIDVPLVPVVERVKFLERHIREEHT